MPHKTKKTEPEMENIYELSNEELKDLVKDGLEDLGVELDSIDIEVEDESRVVLRGRADSRREKELIGEAVEDALGVDDVVNELRVVNPAAVEDDDEADDDDSDDIRDGDNDTAGTQDLSRSVEDGIPYIPPLRRLYREAHGRSKCRRTDGSGSQAV